MADLDELRETFEQVIEAINSRDPELRSRFFHDDIVAFSPFSPFPTTNKVESTGFARGNLSNPYVEASHTAVIGPQYRIVQDTGLCWGHAAVSLKPKDGPLRAFFLRYTFVFVKTGGRWLETCVHMSEVPKPA